MGAKVPADNAFKAAILHEAEADRFRGHYVAWGSVHAWSMVCGAIGGALALFGVMRFF